MFLNPTKPFTWANGTNLMIAQLAKGPVGVAVDARNWRSYASGIYTSFCTDYNINHAVIVTAIGSEGTLSVKNSWGSLWG